MHPRASCARARAILSCARARAVHTGGRQQRAGWGQSDAPFDLPYIGAWDVLYAAGPARYDGALLEPRPRREVAEAPPSSARTGGATALLAARQWVYGPGEGGVAAECEYALEGRRAASGGGGGGGAPGGRECAPGA